MRTKIMGTCKWSDKVIDKIEDNLVSRLAIEVTEDNNPYKD